MMYSTSDDSDFENFAQGVRASNTSSRRSNYETPPSKQLSEMANTPTRYVNRGTVLMPYGPPSDGSKKIIPICNGNGLIHLRYVNQGLLLPPHTPRIQYKFNCARLKDLREKHDRELNPTVGPTLNTFYQFPPWKNTRQSPGFDLTKLVIFPIFINPKNSRNI